MNERNHAHRHGRLAGLIKRASGVIFDFDGPMCRLFPDGTAPQAEEIKEAMLRAGGVRLPGTMTALRDSHAILQELRRDTSATAGLAADLVTRAEYVAVQTARASDHLHAVVTQLAAAGVGLAVASNNDAGPISAFLNQHGLAGHFGNRVYGRDPRALDRMKPDPDSVLRASAGLGLKPEFCLMVGDKVTDLEAAQAAGTLFLGCTDNEAEGSQMAKLGADAVVDSLAPLLDTVLTLTAQGNH
ncbi:HAD-IA family hydrolase [Streptomyces sp. NPDC046716]|uniref:HAD family hydrolase n=1 Tax=Streptomyces sp. NPDC046716 TaxID=3157093 RepID=UPI0033CE520A